MGRARQIKPGFFTNDLLAELDPLERLLFAGMWTLADREGRLEDRPRRIKAEVLPYDTLDGETAIARMAERGFITRYELGGVHYLQVNNWKLHQHPHPKEEPSEIPPPPLAASAVSQPSVMHEPCMTDASAMHESSMSHALNPINPSSSSSSSGTSSSSTPSGRAHAPVAPAAQPRHEVTRIRDSVPKPNRSAEVMDALRALGLEVTLSARDTAAIKHSTARAPDIAEVYGAVFRGDYGDDFMQRRLSVHDAIEWIAGYKAWQQRSKPRAPNPDSARSIGAPPVVPPDSPFQKYAG